jgi:DNA-binding Lrp family transcriptional regulator
MIKLNERERRMLTLLRLQKELLTVPDLARELKIRSHSARYALERLRSMGLYKPSVWSDPFSLGQFSMGLYFSVALGSKRLKPALTWLLKEPRVTWVARLSGRFHYGIGYRVEGLPEMARFLNEFDKATSGIVTDRSANTRLELVNSRVILWGKRAGCVDTLRADIARGRERIDNVDHAIIEALHKDAELSASDLEALLTIPKRTIQGRLKRLRQDKILLGFLNSADPALLGHSSHLLLIETKGLGFSSRERLFRTTTANPFVFTTLATLGTWDFEVFCATPTARDLLSLTDEIEETLGDSLRSIHTITIVDELKLGGVQASIEKF